MRPHLASLVDDLRANGPQTAIVTYRGNRREATTYAQLAALASSFAAELDHRRIAAGERVVLWGQNSAEWVGAFLGCVLRGVLAVPLDAAGAPDFANRVLAETRPRLVIGDDTLLALLGGQAPALPFRDFQTHLPPPGASLPEVKLTRETPLQILFTSGTTAEPKGIVHTHGNVLASMEPIEREMQKYLRYERFVHPLRFLHTLPLSHVFGQFMGLWLPPLLAAEVHFESRLQAPRLLDTIHRERITLLAAVPRVLELLRAHLLALDPALARQLQAAEEETFWKRWWRFRRVHRLFGWKFWAFVCGGASLPGGLEQFWNTLGFALIQGYGMTETAALITLNHPFRIGKGTIGRPLPGREIRISDDGEISVRGEMVATSIWQQGGMRQRADPWLATGDLVARDESGQLRFVGRKSETIVTPSGLNVHPEDVEAALARQPGITACAVVPLTLPQGGEEPMAVIVAPGGAEAAVRAIEQANAELAGYQRIRHWRFWPGADLPRTSTGKVQRGKVAGWAAQPEAAGNASAAADPLLAAIAAIAGEAASRMDDSARLEEDLHLDSLGRLQLQSEIEQRFGVTIEDESFLKIATLGQLRAAAGWRPPSGEAEEVRAVEPVIARPAPAEFLYPRWPWWRPVAAARILFQELLARPLVWLLAAPRVSILSGQPLPSQPMLLIANHVTSLDVPLALYALPPRIRTHVAVATAGEMLEDWRHGRNQDRWWQNWLGPLEYWLLTALYNVFPLPRQAGFRRSFAHAGEALDHGYHVMVFPEGRRSEASLLQPFRAGIGLLARESGAAVLPIALKGLGELKQRRRWFRSGAIEIRVGAPIQIAANETPEEITGRLHETMQAMLC